MRTAVARRERLQALRSTLANRNLIMGVLNLTPDSFSDGGRYDAPGESLRRILEMVEEGADLIDIGAESTRPGAEPVPGDRQISKILPVLEALRSASDIPVSIDTRDQAVASAALHLGADLINDVSALRTSPGMAEMVAREGAGLILMHMRGTPATMQSETIYEDVVAEVVEFLRERVETAERAGISSDSIWVDPGIGFAKTAQGNLEILRNIDRIDQLGYPVVVGVSRKSFIGSTLGRQVGQRLAGTLAVTGYLAGSGVHRIHRVHDIAENRDALRMAEILVREGG